MSQDPFAASHSVSSPAGPPAPWGLVATIVWGVAGFCVSGAAQLAVFVGYVMIHPEAGDAAAIKAMGVNGFLLSIVTIVGAPVWIAVMVLASRRRGWRAADYLALVMPSRGQLLFGLLCMVPLLVAFDVLSYATGHDVVPPFMSETYKSAAASGSLVLFFVAVVIIAPVSEEIVFRGFLFRGLNASFLGVAGTLAVTSVAWALMHIQYDWLGIAQILLIGLLLGWLRWASGSTVLTITLHMMTNFIALMETAIWVEWLS
ncbi:CPBP family intramembrane metalloprotease [Roseiarcaceae bacterium H3SJ34-1]|uniref:CPBP family intramembrane glutamic endopeptidase n=1 Tax=Terripilifer ovatus TaxID=3032367 RepID=UPI003AB9456C|nr:CPBP family intramembrane metalloprotease [Roseiarcaceae bacterium H3SJ34-1]